MLLLNLYLREKGYGESLIGSILSAGAIGMTVTSIPGAILLSKVRLKPVLIISTLLFVISAMVTIYTDSKYVADAVEKNWIFDWEKKNFKKKKNPDLWKRFLLVYRKHKVKFIWIKGHANNPENERCDQLAVMASQQPNLLEDRGYNTESNSNSLF